MFPYCDPMEAKSLLVQMDAMAPRRGSDGNGAAERVVNQVYQHSLLTFGVWSQKPEHKNKSCQNFFYIYVLHFSDIVLISTSSILPVNASVNVYFQILKYKDVGSMKLF
jgi:hypothetical protein